MNTSYLKYLIIPSIATVLYAIMHIMYMLYQMNFIMSSTVSDELRHLLLLNNIIYTLGFLPIIFIPTLIFSVAYKLTQITLKNINYATLIGLVLFALSLINMFFISYIHSSYNTYEYRYYLSIFFIYYSVFYLMIVTLIIMGISMLYIHINKYPLMPTTNKQIGLFYASLFIISTSIQSLIKVSPVLVFEKIPLSTLSYILIICIIISAIYFIYSYTWCKEVLHANKNTTHYPVKIITSYLLIITIFLFISITFHIIELKKPILMPILMMRYNVSEQLITGCIMLSYILSFFLFFILFYCSQSLVYRLAHIAYYLLAAIALIVLILLALPSYRSGFEYGLPIFGYTYGIVALGISVSLVLFYLCNKLSLNLLFKNEKQSNKGIK